MVSLLVCVSATHVFHFGELDFVTCSLTSSLFVFLYSLLLHRPGALVDPDPSAQRLILKMHFSTFIILLATLISGGLAGYSLEDDYFLGNFFDKFAFWDEEDPTHGFVVYQNRSSSEDLGLIERTSDYARWGVDSTNVTPLGRPSIRITSKKTYNYGLIVADIEHMPGGICGTW